MPDIIIGIDPGVSGGIVTLGISNAPILLESMPNTESGILAAIRSLDVVDQPIVVFIEWIHPAIQGIGKSSMSKLYGNYKACRMAVKAVGHRLEEIKPRDWQRGLGIPKRKESETATEWKNRLKDRAKEIYPCAKVTLKTCDALLIAEYGRRVRCGQLTEAKP